MCFVGIVCIMYGCSVNFVSQYVEDPQMKSLLKMKEGSEIMMREERQILDLQLETKREQFKMKEGSEIMMREERQILDLQLETKREQFKMKKQKGPKIIW